MSIQRFASDTAGSSVSHGTFGLFPTSSRPPAGAVSSHSRRRPLPHALNLLPDGPDLTIRSRQVAALASAHRICLAPFEYADLDGWRDAVADAARDCLGGTSAQVTLSGVDGLARTRSPDIDVAHVVAYLRDWMPHDVVLEHVTTHGIRTYSRSRLAAQSPELAELMRRSPLYQDFYRRIGTVDSVGIVDHTDGQVQLVVYHTRFGDDEFARGLNLMQLLEPAFLAGVRAVLDARATNGAFTRLVDDLPGAIALYAPDGRRLHWNAALRRLMEQEFAKPIERALLALARDLSGTGSQSRQGVSPIMRAVVSGHRLTGTLARLGIDGSPPLLMLRVDPTGATEARPPVSPTPPVCPPDALAVLQSLTPRQRDVALLIALGHSNAEIATQLHVSPFTARRHTEQVLTRLGVNSRQRAAALLSPVLHERSSDAA